MIRRKLTRKEAKEKEYLIWNAFVDLVTMEKECNLSEIQMHGKRAFDYDSEIQNGGHLQYFENYKHKDHNQVIESLLELNEIKQANLLEQALAIYNKKERPIIKDSIEYSKIALEGEFDELDLQYYKENPPLTEFMEEYIHIHSNQFVEFID